MSFEIVNKNCSFCQLYHQDPVGEDCPYRFSNPHAQFEIARLKAELAGSENNRRALDEALSDLQGRLTTTQADYERLQRTVAFMEAEYLKEHGHWGNCRFKAERDTANELLKQCRPLLEPHSICQRIAAHLKPKEDHATKTV